MTEKLVPFNVLPVATCMVTLCALYCMLILRTAGKGSERLAIVVNPRSRKLHLPTSPSSITRHNHSLRPTTGQETMLRGALKEHEQKHARATVVDASSANSTLSGFTQNPEKSQTDIPNPGYKNPLKPSSASTLNTLKDGSLQSGGALPIKRTASGLAKVFDGKFEDVSGSQKQPIMIHDQSPAKNTASESFPTDLFDENDFDSDVDLDVEEPKPLSRVTYPKLPQQTSQFAPIKPFLYPSLPRQQQVQTDISQSFDFPGNSPYASKIKPSPNSSTPIPWSSSPLEHHSSILVPPQVQSLAFGSNETNQVSNTRQADPSQQLPAKRRTLPWRSGDVASDLEPAPPTAPRNSKVGGTANVTPLTKDRDQNRYPWNTSASAVKEQQRKHREEAKKAVKKIEGTEESIRGAVAKRQRTARVFLSDEQQHVLELVTEKKKSVFFTGSAGTGKSVLMREIISSLRQKYHRDPERIAVTASTGLAACNVGGVTLHSFAGIGLGKEDIPELVKKIRKNQKAKNRWHRTKVLIIDEVSMVDGELFDKLEAIARQIRGNARPFGGIQLVITGDFFQLPPVPDQSKVAKFAFDAATWRTSVEHTIGLHHVFRQKDPSEYSYIPHSLA